MKDHLLSAVVLTFALFFITIKLNAQSSECDSIVWSQNRKLVWEDFRGKPIDAARAAARSNYNFLHKWNVDKGMLTAGVVCIFSPMQIVEQKQKFSGPIKA